MEPDLFTLSCVHTDSYWHTELSIAQSTVSPHLINHTTLHILQWMSNCLHLCNKCSLIWLNTFWKEFKTDLHARCCRVIPFQNSTHWNYPLLLLLTIRKCWRAICPVSFQHFSPLSGGLGHSKLFFCLWLLLVGWIAATINNVNTRHNDSTRLIHLSKQTIENYFLPSFCILCHSAAGKWCNMPTTFRAYIFFLGRRTHGMKDKLSKILWSTDITLCSHFWSMGSFIHSLSSPMMATGGVGLPQRCSAGKTSQIQNYIRYICVRKYIQCIN